MPLLSFLKTKLFYGWGVVIIILIIGILLFGIRNSFGVFFKSIEGEFGLTRAVTSGVLSVYMLLGCVFAILGGWALDRYGPRIVILLMGFFTGFSLLLTSQTNSLWQLFITYSLLLSMGTGAAYPVLISTVSRWFDKNRGFAIGVASLGGPLGMIAVAPFATYLIANFSWRISFIVLGIIAGLVVMSLSMLLRKDPGEMAISCKDNREGKPVSFSLKQTFKKRNYWFLWAAKFFCGYVYFLVFTHLVPHITDVGISPMMAAVIFSLLAGVSMPGRLLMGIVSDRIDRRFVPIICAVFMAGAMIWLIWSHDLWMFYLFAVVYGFAYGGIDTSLTALVVDVFGVSSIGAIMGTLTLGFLIGSAIGPFIGGVVFDVSNSYSLAFALGATVMLLTIPLLALVSREVNLEIK